MKNTFFMTLSTISDTKFQNLIGVTDFANSMTFHEYEYFGNIVGLMQIFHSKEHK